MYTRICMYDSPCPSVYVETYTFEIFFITPVFRCISSLLELNSGSLTISVLVKGVITKV